MSEPEQWCSTCGRAVTVVQSGRGFPPDTAKRKLAKLCKEAGHVSKPQYTAGIGGGLLRHLSGGAS